MKLGHMLESKQVVVLLALPMLLAGCALRPFLRKVNSVRPHDAREVVSDEASRLHRQLFVADFHADPLLLAKPPGAPASQPGIDLRVRSSGGHIDLPRLREGRVAIQVFGVPTRVPYGIVEFFLAQNFSFSEHIRDSKLDAIRTVAREGKWPRAARGSPLERARYQAEMLHAYERAVPSQLMVVTSQEDLETLFRRREEQPDLIGGVLGLEGAHALEPETGEPCLIGNVAELDDMGFRIFGLVHFFDNCVAGSAHGQKQGGLEGPGRELLRELGRRHLAVDLSHASDDAIDDVLAFLDTLPPGARPALGVSHTGVWRAACDEHNQRPVKPETLERIIQAGGLIGMGFFESALCGETVADIAEAIAFVASLDDGRGLYSVSLGSDFDGMVSMPIDASEYVYLVDALLKAGFSHEAIHCIMGENLRDWLARSLPPR